MDSAWFLDVGVISLRFERTVYLVGATIVPVSVCRSGIVGFGVVFYEVLLEMRLSNPIHSFTQYP